MANANSTKGGDQKIDKDAELRVDNEDDTLFDDGLELEDDTPLISGTDGSDNTKSR